MDYSKNPEYSFIEDFNEDEISSHPDDSIYEIDKLSWIGTNSGNTIDILYNYIQKYMRGEAEFLVIWEGGDSIQKVVVIDDGEKCSCKITQL